MADAPNPADAVNPFINKEVVCPVCEKKSFQRRVKSHLFAEKSRDVDYRPTAYQRSKPGLERIQPLVYFLWHCPHCRYTAWPGAFDSQAKGVSLSAAKLRGVLLNPPGADTGAGRLLTRLAAGLDDPERDFFLGVKQHLLAIFQILLMQAQSGARDGQGLGRYYLRLSWLYREMAEQAHLQGQGQQVAALLAEVCKDWPQAPRDADSAALRAAQAYENALGQPGALETHGEVCDLMLLVTRIYIKLQRPDLARLSWSRAHEMVRSADSTKRSLEDQYSKLQDQARSSTKVVADAAKAAMPEISAKIVEMDALGRSMRNKSQEVRNILHDLDGDILSMPGGPDAEKPPEDKPKKKFFGLFK